MNALGIYTSPDGCYTAIERDNGTILLIDVATGETFTDLDAIPADFSPWSTE